MKLDLAKLPAGALVHEAMLHLSVVDSDGAPEDIYSVSVHKVEGRLPVLAKATGYTADGVAHWTPSACCHDNVPLAQADISPSYDTLAIDKTAGNKAWAITQMVQDWLAAPGTNAGLLLNPDGSALRDRYRRFASMEHPDARLRPRLWIAYSRSPAADPTPPSVSIIARAIGATVAGTVALVANTSDNNGVSGVQFTVDGVPLGAERTAAPYSIAWDAGSAADGSHTVIAVARDGAGNVKASAPLRVIVEKGTVVLASGQTTR